MAANPKLLRLFSIRTAKQAGWDALPSTHPVRGIPPALQAGASSAVNHRVFRRELVAVIAMCFFSVALACFAPADVFFSGDWFKVVWIDATTNAAEMVELQAVRYRPAKASIDQSVWAISSTQPSHPNPATGFGNRDIVFKNRYSFISHAPSSRCIGQGRAMLQHCSGSFHFTATGGYF